MINQEFSRGDADRSWSTLNEMTGHCCNQMAMRVEVIAAQGSDGTSDRPLLYDCVFDEYLVAIDGWAAVPLRYCPWCGRRQRLSKRQRWYAEIAALGLSADHPRLPEAFQSDAWWTDPSTP